MGLKGTFSWKSFLKGPDLQKSMLKGQFTKKGSFAILWPFFEQFGRKIFLGQKPLFGPFLGLENNFSPYFGHFLTNLAKKNFWPKTTIWTLFRTRKQLFAIIWPFFDQFGQKKFLGQKPLFGPSLGPEN